MHEEIQQTNPFPRSESAVSLKSHLSQAMGKQFTKTGVVSINPTSQKIAGAIAQAKREQTQGGTFDATRQTSFIKFLEKQDLTQENFPPKVWQDLLGICEGVLSGLWMLVQYNNMSSEQNALHKGFVDVIYRVLLHDPSRIKLLNTQDEQQLEALQIIRLVQSTHDKEAVNLGVNICQLLIHNSPSLTLKDLVKFDMETRDVIQKRESTKLWEAINSLGSQVDSLKTKGAQEGEIDYIVDEKLEQEMEVLNTKLSKQMAAFFQNKIKDVNTKIDGQEVTFTSLSGHVKQLEGTVNGELAKIHRQVKDLGEGKVTSEAELQQIGEQQAYVDKNQDSVLVELKLELSNRIDALQKEVKKLKMMSGSHLQSNLISNAATMPRSKTGNTLQLQQLQAGARDGGDVKHRLDDHQTEIDQLKSQIEIVLLNSTGDTLVQKQIGPNTATSVQNVPSNISKDIKLLEDKTKKGFLAVKQDHTKIRVEIKQYVDESIEESADLIQGTCNDLDSLTARFDAFQKEAAKLSAESKIAPLPAAPTNAGQESSDAMKALEDKTKQGFGKVRTDFNEMQKIVDEMKAQQKTNFDKVEPMIKDSQAGLETKLREELKQSTFDGQFSSQDSALIQSTHNDLQSLTERFNSFKEEAKVAFENTQAQQAKVLATEAAQLQTSPQKESNAIAAAAPSPELETKMKTLEDRTKQGFAKVKTDFTAVQKSLDEVKAQQKANHEQVEPMAKDSQAGLLSLLEQFDAFKEEFAAAQTQMTQAMSQIQTPQSDSDLNAATQKINELDLKVTELETKLDQKNGAERESSGLPSTAISSNEKSLEELKEQLSQLEARTKKGFLKVKTDFEEAKKAAQKQEQEENNQDSTDQLVKSLQTEFTESLSKMASEKESVHKRCDEIVTKMQDLEAQYLEQQQKTAEMQVLVENLKSQVDSSPAAKVQQSETPTIDYSQTIKAIQEQLEQLEQRTQIGFKRVKTDIKEVKATNVTKTDETPGAAAEEPEQVEEPAEIEVDSVSMLKINETETLVKNLQQQFQGKIELISADLDQIKTQQLIITNQPSDLDARLAAMDEKIDQVSSEKTTKTPGQSAEPVQSQSAANAIEGETWTEIKKRIDEVEQSSQTWQTEFKLQLDNLGQELTNNFNKIKKEMDTQIAEVAAVNNAKEGEQVEKNKTTTENNDGIDQGKFERLSSMVEVQDQGSRLLERKMSQLDETTTQVRTQLIELKAETKIAIEDVKTVLDGLEQPMRMETLVKQDDIMLKKGNELEASAGDHNIVSHEADIADLYAKIDAIEDQSTKETKKFNNEIKKLNEQIETRICSIQQTSVIADDTPKDPSATVQQVQDIDTKLDTHIEEVKQRMTKQGQLFKKIQDYIKTLQSQMKSKVAAEGDEAGEAGEKPKKAAAATATAIESDQLIQLTERVDEIHQLIDPMAKNITDMVKQIKKNAAKTDAAATKSELQALKSEFENLQHDMRTSLLGVERTQSTVLTSIEELKSVTESDLKSVNTKIDTDLAIVSAKIDTGLVTMQKSAGSDVEQLKESLTEKSNALKIDLDAQVKQLDKKIQSEMTEAICETQNETKAMRKQLQVETQKIQDLIFEQKQAMIDSFANQKAEVKTDLEGFQVNLTDAQLQVSSLKTDHETLKDDFDQKVEQDIESGLALDKKLRGLHKKVKTDIDDHSGKLKADMSLMQSDQKITLEKMVFIERFMDRIRASNNHGEPIVNFNEDSATKEEMQLIVAEEFGKMQKRMKELKRQNSEKNPIIDDVQEDVQLLKEMFRKHQTKIDQMQAEEISPKIRPAFKSEKQSPREGLIPSDQLKRILALIENNSSAMAMQRDTFSNIMVRVQLLEKYMPNRRNILDQHRSNHQAQSELRGSKLPAAISRNQFSTLTKDESTDASFSRALPKSLERRRDSHARRGAEASSLPRGIKLPSQLHMPGMSDSEINLYNPNSAKSKRSMIRANLYNQTPNASLDNSKHGAMSPIKAKRLSRAPSQTHERSEHNEPNM